MRLIHRTSRAATLTSMLPVLVGCGAGGTRSVSEAEPQAHECGLPGSTITPSASPTSAAGVEIGSTTSDPIASSVV